MDDFTEKLSALLSDKQGMEKIKSMAENLFSGQEENSPASDISSAAKLLPLISKFSAMGEDERVRLISALRPYLSAERKKRADKAIKILKAAAFVPLLSESGLFEL